MASIGCPIAADTLYGYRNSSVNLDRHFLHAYQLSICLLGEKEPHHFQAELPAELTNVLEKLF
jgi:23S rRNA pseudouridine1911/1915/1917 synthase